MGVSPVGTRSRQIQNSIRRDIAKKLITYCVLRHESLVFKIFLMASFRVGYLRRVGPTGNKFFESKLSNDSSLVEDPFMKYKF